MADVTCKRLEELDRYEGEFQTGQDFFFAGQSLGVSAWGMNVLRMPPHWEHYPEHDHVGDEQEEVYVVLEGSATMKLGDESIALERGMFVRVPPHQPRKIVPGPAGATVLALGGTPGKPYEPGWGRRSG
ncbi:MAG TPA: cupin domain-containing protein [Nannocystaceae bacterium]|nr:cupin domain-containing protein [Nannocystaceae bacterium]